MTHDSTRRTALATGAAALAAGCVGCGTYGESTNSGETKGSRGEESGKEESGPSAGAAAGQALAKTSEIPVGGGTIFREQKIVVTQPNQNEFKAFSAVCTHLGCTMARVVDRTIDCPCHGSKFDITDGSVAHGPATKPLPPENIRVDGGTIQLA
ncbi:Rieske (2Fe-2S) protein [Streptomyces sp. HUAS TT20]|uniref:Rieske (2Fe-2S) protein n=1 Tax=Streptomyces sp. HUAS TT20 TaxID=3447509 RepID=UPI0021D91023|nr:Rieske (2Fe-2S) protein [Streptomyces sp. HUAS 15-9]UXY26682.1 Rieske (2Fe-2S) protein [Streptomyces sp. HUAS 15-9]